MLMYDKMFDMRENLLRKQMGRGVWREIESVNEEENKKRTE